MIRVMAVTIALGALSTGWAQEWSTAQIQRRAEQIKNSESHAWKKIPWASSLLSARKISIAEKRPIFLFTHDGNIETGRC